MNTRLIETSVGLVEVVGVAKLLHDDVLGKLIHDDIMLAMTGAGFTPIAITVLPKPDGSVFVGYAVRFSAEELESLPSFYDEPARVKPSTARAKKRKRK